MKALWLLAIPLAMFLLASMMPRAEAIVPATCETEIPDAVGPTSALLRGILISLGGSPVNVTVAFRFGTSPALIGATDLQAFPAVVRANGMGFNRTQTDLLPGSNYFYAAICTNVSGTFVGAIVPVRTNAGAPSFTIQYLLVFLIVWIFLIILGIPFPPFGIFAAILGFFLGFEIFNEYGRSASLAPPETLIPLTAIVEAISLLVLVFSLMRFVDEGFTMDI